jgi:serine phosphatase RsbU (regulator of sigma subunit)
LLTDGFREVLNQSGKELGLAALESSIVEHADRPLRKIAQNLQQRADNYGKQADDQTILLIRCFGSDAGARLRPLAVP